MDGHAILSVFMVMLVAIITSKAYAILPYLLFLLIIHRFFVSSRDTYPGHHRGLLLQHNQYCVFLYLNIYRKYI